MKSMTKGRIKLELVHALMFSPVLLAYLAGLWLYHPPKANAMPPLPPASYRVLWYPNCSPAWAGGTIWQQGICVPDCSYGIPTAQYCGNPVYMPTLMPQMIGTNTSARMVIDISTNYCSTGDIVLGFSYTEELTYAFGIPSWIAVPGTTNLAVMPNGIISMEWAVTTTNILNLRGVIDAVPVLGKTLSWISCPGGTGTGGQ